MPKKPRSPSLLTKLVAGAFVAAIGASSAGAAETIKLGVLMPTSGGGAAYGIPAINGVKLAIEEINAAGGVLGKKLEFVVRDTKLKPATGVAAARELITKDGVVALIGAVSSGVSLAVSQVAKQEKIVLIAPISKSIKLTREKKNKYTFQSSFNTEASGRVMAGIVEKRGIKKLCVTGFDYAYSYDLFDAVKRNLKSAKVSATYYVKLGTKDYNGLISKLMSSDCDGVAGAIWGGGFIAFAKQAKPFGLFKKKKFIWGAEVGSTEMTGKLKGDYPTGMWANAYDLWYYTVSPKHAAFHAKLAKLEGTKETNMWPITTYVAVKFLAAGIAKAGSTNSDKLVAALRGLSIDTPLGKRTIGAKTNRVNTGEFWGEMKPVGPGGEFRMVSPQLLE